MATSVFYSFHYRRDIFRVQRIANIGALDGQALNRQEWEQVKRGGKSVIEKYIDGEMAYKRAVVVLVGTETASRPWVLYEIRKAWNDKKPIVGIRINGLVDTPAGGSVDPAGPNPFAKITLETPAFLPPRTLADHIPLHTPNGYDSKSRFADIRANIHSWVDGAVRRS